jgi:hypothetical protein
VADLTTLTSPFTAAQARALLAIGLEDMPLYPAEVDLDIDSPASRHEFMRSLDDWPAQAVDRSGRCFPDDPFDVPSLTRIAADTLRGWRADEWLL